MTDKLVKDLRDSRFDGQLMMRAQAANRIEELEAALRKIAKHDLQSIALNALVQKLPDPFAGKGATQDEK